MQEVWAFTFRRDFLVARDRRVLLRFAARLDGPHPRSCEHRCLRRCISRCAESRCLNQNGSSFMFQEGHAVAEVAGKIPVISLFAGCGALELGLSRLGPQPKNPKAMMKRQSVVVTVAGSLFPFRRPTLQKANKSLPCIVGFQFRKHRNSSL